MSLFKRRILYLLSIGVFLVGIPIVIGYGTGFRFDWSTKKFIQMGGIYVSSLPRSAHIFIDGKHVGSKTPLQVRFLLPKKYSLEITKSGFLPITATVAVSAGKVVLINNIELLPLKSSQQQEIPNVSRIFISPIDDRIIISKQTSDKFEITYVASEGFSKIGTLSSDVSQIIWDAYNHDELLTTESSEHWYHANLATELTGPLQAIKSPFTLSTTRGEVIVSKDGVLSSYNFMQQKYEPLNFQGEFAFTLGQSNNYIIATKDDNGLLHVANRNNNIVREIGTIPNVVSIQLIRPQTALLTTSQGVYLISDVQQAQMQLLSTQITAYAIYESRFVYSTGVELWEMDLNSAEKKFLTRFGELCTGITFSPNLNALLLVFPSHATFFHTDFDPPVLEQIPFQANTDRVHFVRIGSKSFRMLQMDKNKTLVLYTYQL